MQEAVQQLIQCGMAQSDQSIVDDILLAIEKYTYIQDKEIFIGGHVLENFYQFLDGFTSKKLASILKIFNTKIKNVMLENFVEVQETSPNINPFFVLQQQVSDE